MRGIAATITMPAYCRSAAMGLFRQQLADLETTDGLFRAAFALALHERPEAQLADAEATVDRLAQTVNARVQSRSTTALLAHLHDVLFDLFGLRGNRADYYNPANSYVPDVLRTRRGIPISLTLIYKRVAAPLGLTVYGVNAPGHFLAEVNGGDDRESMYVDPFFGGGVLHANEIAERVAHATDRPVVPTHEVLARATHRQWLVRMLTNLQAAFAVAGQQRDVCAMQELQGLL